MKAGFRGSTPAGFIFCTFDTAAFKRDLYYQRIPEAEAILPHFFAKDFVRKIFRNI